MCANEHWDDTVGNLETFVLSEPGSTTSVDTNPDFGYELVTNCYTSPAAAKMKTKIKATR